MSALTSFASRERLLSMSAWCHFRPMQQFVRCGILSFQFPRGRQCSEMTLCGETKQKNQNTSGYWLFSISSYPFQVLGDPFDSAQCEAPAIGPILRACRGALWANRFCFSWPASWRCCGSVFCAFQAILGAPKSRDCAGGGDAGGSWHDNGKFSKAN